jgi:hypothetical protein
MLPFLGRSLGPKRARSHRNTVSSQRVNMVIPSSSLFVEGHVRFLCRPDVVEQNGQLPRHCDNRLVPSLLTASRGQMKSPLSKR